MGDFVKVFEVVNSIIEIKLSWLKKEKKGNLSIYVKDVK